MNSYVFYNLLLNNDNEKIEAYINTLNINTIKDNGILSNLIVYLVKHNDIRILAIIDNIDNYKLMKRDYLMICKYYYNYNIDKALEICNKYIVNKLQLLPKDIDFIIENNLIKLLYLFKGLYIKSSVNIAKYNHTNIINESYENDLLLLQDIKKSINSHIHPSEKDKLLDFLHNTNYNYIIDACNVLFHNGRITNKNINNLYKIINSLDNVLVIIHIRHIKHYPEIKEYFDKHNIKYYLTPYKHNDDLFIINAFINNYKSYIISNDKYRDHINNYNKDLYNYGQFKNIIFHHTLSYDFNNISPKKKYTENIQIINDKILVPHNTGGFILLTST